LRHDWREQNNSLTNNLSYLQSLVVKISRNANLTDATRLSPLTLLQPHHKMPPQRTPLRTRDGNRGRGADLTPYERGLIIRATCLGKRPSWIEREFDASRGAVKSTIQNENLRP
jgi:hypothetical protein